MIRVDIKRHPGKLSMLARGKAAEVGVSEVYVHGVDNVRKVQWLRDRGHDPLEVPDEVKRMARELAKVGVRSLDDEKAKRTLTAAAQYTAKWLRDRIISGLLGTMKLSTIERKLWLIDHGRATAAYGRPGPYGICTGHLVRSILARWRPGRGG